MCTWKNDNDNGTLFIHTIDVYGPSLISFAHHLKATIGLHWTPKSDFLVSTVAQFSEKKLVPHVTWNRKLAKGQIFLTKLYKVGFDGTHKI